MPGQGSDGPPWRPRPAPPPGRRGPRGTPGPGRPAAAHPYSRPPLPAVTAPHASPSPALPRPLLAARPARSRLRTTRLPFTLTGTCSGLSLGATVMSESESESCPSSMSPASCAIFPRRGAAGQENTSGAAAGRAGGLRLLGRPREGSRSRRDGPRGAFSSRLGPH